MTQDDIKELALRVATEMYIGEDVVVERYNLDQFATRFLAAYLAEQEPDGWIDGEGDPYSQHGWGKKPPPGWTTCEEYSYPVFRAPPLPDTAPQEGTTRPAAPPARETPVGAATSMFDTDPLVTGEGWAKMPARPATPEDQKVYASIAANYNKVATPLSIPVFASANKHVAKEVDPLRKAINAASRAAPPNGETLVEVANMKPWDLQHDDSGKPVVLYTADMLERLAAENAALTQERDELKFDVETISNFAVEVGEQLAASHTREANLREAITASLDTVGHAENARNILVNALSMPSDDTALRERLKEERALCAKVCNDRRRTVSNGNGISFFSHDAASIEAGFCADAILMLT